MSSTKNVTNSLTICKPGILISTAAATPRNALFYFAALLYCFLGIAIAADIFMCSIEQITSATRKVKKKKNDHRLVAENQSEDDDYEIVRVWNPTVANLTLMALGSSAPEILLSIIEIVGNNFSAGSLGPGTIVGSAAFNLFGISAICVLAVGQTTKRIELYRVFVVTAFFGTFAYVWLFLILTVITPNVVNIWEALLTFLFFPILVFIAYSADIEIWKTKTRDNFNQELELINNDDRATSPSKRSEKLGAQIEKWASAISLAAADGGHTSTRSFIPIDATPSLSTVREWARTMSQTYPSLSDEDHAKILAYRVARKMSHDRMYYRIKAVRQLSSSWRKSQEEEVEKLENFNDDQRSDQVDAATSTSNRKTFVEFSARVYRIFPNDHIVRLKILRKGNLSSKFTVCYTTVNGVAKKDLNFLFKSEVLQFSAGEAEKEIQIQLVEPSNWRPNDVFYIHLKTPETTGGGGGDNDDTVRLGQCNVARVKLPDESSTPMPGGSRLVEFVRPNYVVKENAKRVRVFVVQRGATKCRPTPTLVSFETEDVTAKHSEDYVAVRNGIIRFENYEYEKFIDIDIIDDKLDEKDETFIIELLKVDAPDVSIGTKRKTTVTIISDDNALKNIINVHKLVSHYIREMKPGRASWREQILNAVSVNSGDLANATIGDCVLHALAFPWKFVFAFLPPPIILNGWPCFLVALAAVGFLTAVVGDVASIFGCMVGMKDAVTAITLVALGTSLPDTFASKIAAESEESADNAVGNVTGSNSVNVFLGLGLPWLAASIYWAINDGEFRVEAGDLGFSVSIFMLFSFIFLFILVLRRNLSLFGRGELGGPFAPKILSAISFIGLWIIYVALSIWKTNNA